MAHNLICKQEIGDSFSGVYHVDACHIKLTVNEKEYSDLTLRDKSGSRSVKLWERAELNTGDWVLIKAHVDDYQGNASVVARSLSVESEPSNLDDYIATYDTKKHLDTFEEINGILDELSEEADDQTCNVLLDEVFATNDLLDSWQKSPGSANAHYGKIGGLFANTIRVADYAIKICDQYDLNKKEKMVLICAAILHRIGAVDCYSTESLLPDITKKGYLLGVTNMSLARITMSLSRIKVKVDNDIILRVLHAIASCGSVKPMTKEAMVLQAASKADYEMVEAMEFIDQDMSINEEQQFTAYHSGNSRRYYIGK